MTLTEALKTLDTDLYDVANKVRDYIPGSVIGDCDRCPLAEYLTSLVGSTVRVFTYSAHSKHSSLYLPPAALAFRHRFDNEELL